MKKAFTFFAAMAVSLNLSAYYGPSKLSISTTGISNIRVMVDGNRIRANNNAVMINNLNEGYHTIRIYQLKTSRGGGLGNGNGGNNMNNYQLVYNSSIFLKPQYHVDIVINRFGKAFTDEQPIGAGYYEEDDDWGNNDNWNNNNGSGYNNTAMDARVFEQFKQSLRKEIFDDSRQNIAKQTISTNYFTSTQVREILQLFNFENSKLEIAKYAYKYTVDKGSYFLLNDVFAFSTSKDELLRYIQSYK